MAREAEVWEGRITTSATAKSLVKLGDIAVPSTVTMRFEGSEDAPAGRRWPTIVLRFEVRDGEPVCVELRVESAPGDRPVSLSELRGLDLDGLAALAFERHALETQEAGRYVIGSGTTARAASELRAQRLSRGAENLAELREVARVYLAPSARRKPTQSVVDVLGYGSRETASRRIAAARRKDLIPEVGASDDKLDEYLQRLNEATVEGESVDVPDRPGMHLGTDPIPISDFESWWNSKSKGTR